MPEEDSHTLCKLLLNNCFSQLNFLIAPKVAPKTFLLGTKSGVLSFGNAGLNFAQSLELHPRRSV